VRVLLVEDAAKVARVVKRGLEEEGFAVDAVACGEDALWMASQNDYDAIILDLRLPDIDGYEVCRRLRDASDWSPVLMLTARDAVEDRVVGLDAGADDYLTKPFAFTELLARLRALFRRGRSSRAVVLAVGDLVLDPATRTVQRGDAPIVLTAKEFALLEYFMRHPGEVLSRARLLEHVWDFAFDGDPHVVTVHVSSLRDKIDRAFARESLETVRSFGYRLRDDRLPALAD
jgi:two-component system, OmpR family, response regulator